MGRTITGWPLNWKSEISGNLIFNKEQVIIQIDRFLISQFRGKFQSVQKCLIALTRLMIHFIHV